MDETSKIYQFGGSGTLDPNLILAMNGGGGFGGGMNNPFWALILLAFLRNVGWNGNDAEESGIDRKGEEFQYLSGEIFRQSYPVAKMFICGGCRRGRR